MICAKTVLDTSLDTSRRAPPQGLAIDFALTGMGFALSKLFALGMFASFCLPLSQAAYPW